jgi:putative ABC transport system substrate-binding protein
MFLDYRWRSAPSLETKPPIMIRAAAAVLLIFVVFASGAQERDRPYRIGVLNEAWAANHPSVEGLKAGLREWGFTEGRDVTFDIHFTKGNPSKTNAAAVALVKAGVDLIFASDDSATLAAKRATQRIPIVFTLVGDPVGAQIVKSLSQPGGNITGVSNRAVELAPKRMQMLTMLAPRIRRVWFIFHVADVTAASALERVRQAATVLDIELLVRKVSGAQELDSALKEIQSGDGVLAPSVDTIDIPALLLEVASRVHAPAIFHSELYVNHGAVMSYGPGLRAQGVQAARLVAKIMRGIPPRDLPVERADTISLSVNLKTAAQMGLPVSQKVLVRANIVRR